MVQDRSIDGISFLETAMIANWVYTHRYLLWNIGIGVCAILVSLLYILPQWAIARHVQANGMPFLLNSESHRTDLHYITRAREVYEGHFPVSDPSLEDGRPTALNMLSPLPFAFALKITGGNIIQAYFIIVAIFSALIFLLFYFLGFTLFRSRVWALFFALVGILTPIALRIFNFDSGA